MIQKEQAVVGHEFVFLGPSAECKECRVKSACLNQSDGRQYRVIKVRNVTHDCPLNGDVVRVVEVEASAPPASLDVNAAREGSIVSFQKRTCDEVFCDNFALCQPRGLDSGAKIQILEVRGKLDCTRGHRLVAAKVAYTAE